MGGRSRTSRSGSRARPADRAAARWSGERVQARTAFALAEVVPEAGQPWRRLLRLDGEDCSHVDLHDPTRIEFAYVRRLADLADLLAPPAAPLDALHLGGGGFTLPRYLAATRPGSRSEVAEVDAELVELGRQALGLRTSRALRVRIADGRAVLERRRPGSADLVVLDAFDGQTIPPHLTTAECAGAARRALRDGGAYAVNVIDAPPLAVARPLVAAVRTAFPHVAVVASRKVLRGRQGGNLVVIGAARALPLAGLRRRAIAGPTPELVLHGGELDAWLGGVRPARDGD